MERWEIRSTPSAHDPHRHQLLIQGGPSDVAALLKKFGAMLGRPSPVRTEAFNLSLAVHRLTPEAREKLEAWLRKAAPPAAPAPVEPGTPPPDLSPAPKVAAPPPPSAPPAAKPLPEPPRPAAIPAPAAPLPAGPALGLRPDLTLETLIVGAFNRFAHAAATSVATSPGSMYNPLFLQGAPGTGKSHLMNAIGVALAKELGGDILLTSGPRLCRAVGAARPGKSGGPLDQKLAAAKALLVDDLHLLSVTDQNKDALAKVFKPFFDRQQQVVVASLYPPRALGGLEEALKFPLSKGYAVDLKTPSPAIQKELIAAAAERAGAGFGAEEIVLLRDKLSAGSYPEMSLWLRRLVALKTMRAASGQSTALASLLELIFDPLTAGGGSAAAPPGLPPPPPVPGKGETMVVLSPKGEEEAGKRAAAAFEAAGTRGGFPRYRPAAWDSYDPAVPFGAPFLIGDICARAGVRRALLVGPMPDTPLGARTMEFAHATRHILESDGGSLGWIPFPGLALAAHYLNAHLDFARIA